MSIIQTRGGWGLVVMNGIEEARQEKHIFFNLIQLKKYVLNNFLEITQDREFSVKLTQKTRDNKKDCKMNK